MQPGMQHGMQHGTPPGMQHGMRHHIRLQHLRRQPVSVNSRCIFFEKVLGM